MPTAQLDLRGVAACVTETAMNLILPRLFDTFWLPLRRQGTAADRKPKWNVTVPPARRKDDAPLPRRQAQ